MPKRERKPRLRLVAAATVQPESDRMEVRTPEGWRPSDKTIAAPFSDNTFAPEGLYEGDVAVIYSTADVTPDDLAVIREGEGLWFGKYRRAPGGYFTFERDGEVTRYKPGTASLAGRVCH